MEAFRGTTVNILAQEFIKEFAGTDIRAIVVGGKIVAVMKRTGGEGEFRSNPHRGGSAQLITISPEERSTAIRAAKSIRSSRWGLRFAVLICCAPTTVASS
nr:hypothetical protein [Octadecabacter antarcticus]